MVLVYLKSLLFPSTSSPQAIQNGTLRIKPPKPKYDTFTSPSLFSPSPSTHSGSETSPLLLLPSSPNTHSIDVEAAIVHGDDEDSEVNSKTSQGFFSPRVISDAIIGLSDGLTVPFALTAGLSTFNDTRVVVYGGLAELIAGSISMGLGGWLAARGEGEYYTSTVNRTLTMIEAYHSQHRRASTSPTPSPNSPHDNREQQATSPHLSSSPRSTTSLPATPIPKMLEDIFTPYNLPPTIHNQLLAHLLSPTYPRTQLLNLLIRFHHSLTPPNPHRATISALTISMGYFLGGFVPLIPYFFVGRQEVMRGLAWSVGVMAVCLFGFGGWKTGMMDQEFLEEEEEREEGWAEEGEWRARWWKWRRWRKILKGGVEMVVVGGLAAGGAMGIVRLLGSG